MDGAAVRDVARRLRAAGCVAADEEAAELVAMARNGEHLDAMIARRVGGEPLAWITGAVTFCGMNVTVAPGVYVPRWQSEVVALEAASRLRDGGRAVDLCCGSGAVAKVLTRRVPASEVVATDLDDRAVACARSNGVDARPGDLFGPVGAAWRGTVDVVVAVPPYVPTDHLAKLAPTPEPRVALDGGGDGLAVIRRVVETSPAWLREGGSLVVELGAPQVDVVTRVVASRGFTDVEVLRDGDDDVCGVACRFRQPR
ncbi:MAG TPA: HemK family protein methyltransferase [Acidimicrobiales bacterium]|jgi:release factor glutamine methyltransferase|nr:HemK family protein methyltransferase [Acidimicrobiales bacterium]